jgi:hypothetical protein
VESTREQSVIRKAEEGERRVSTYDVVFFTLFGFIYIAVAFTIGRATYRKGRIVLFIVGFLIPPLWLLGALLPARSGSKHKGEMGDLWS